MEQAPAPKPLQRMFSGVPRTYDWLNRTLTLGMDQPWRKVACRHCLARNPERVLDLCTGTGDLAILFAQNAQPGAQITALDFAAPMLEVARRKSLACGLSARIEFVEGNAAEMPFPDGHFQALGIAFAFRNLTFRNRLRQSSLAEMRRVLSPGGRAVIVETSQPRSGLLRFGFHAYMRAVVGPLGGLLSGQRPAYRYLSTSARNFYDAHEVDQLLLGAGFDRVEHRLFMDGVAALHLAHVD